MPNTEIGIVEYEDDAGRNAFARWLAKLDNKAYSKVFSAIARMKLGNFGDSKPVGEGVSERRIDYGPGYRIYFGKDGKKLVILLGGGTKSRQSQDIQSAQEAWAEYKKNKRRKKTNGTH
jgi:putative addiction module killer protein